MLELIDNPKKRSTSRSWPGIDEAFKGFTMIGIMTVFFLIMQGPYGVFKDMVRALPIEGYLRFILGHSLVSFLFIPGIFLLFTFLSRMASKNRDVPIKKVLADFAYLFIPIGLAAWAAFSVGIIMPNGSYLLHVLSDPFAWGWNLFGTAKFPWTPFMTGIMPHLQILILIIGLIFSLEYGYKISRRIFAEAGEAIRGWIPMALFLIGVYISLIWLFVG